MNYRHAYHAGNFADVVKHAVLARCLVHLNHKPAPYRVIDTHAGIGGYDLGAIEALKTGEAQAGVVRVLGAELSPTLEEFLAPWLEVVRLENPTGEVHNYPGSPRIAAHHARHDDALFFNELHPADADRLVEAFPRDRRVRFRAEDGWTVAKSLVPPAESRALVIIDPPFEKTDEFERLAEAAGDIHRRFAVAMQILWYPLKDLSVVREFHASLAASGIRKILRLETRVAAVHADGPLSGAGLLVINPPWRLHEEATRVWPELVQLLATGTGFGGRVDWLVPE